LLLQTAGILAYQDTVSFFQLALKKEIQKPKKKHPVSVFSAVLVSLIAFLAVT
jgi:hypothetical protein